MRILLKRILCATDFSDFSNHAIPYGIALAREFKAKLYVSHVIDLSSAAIYGEAVFALEEQQMPQALRSVLGPVVHGRIGLERA